MIDKEFIRNQLFGERIEERLITPNDYITFDVVELLRSGHYSYRNSCFKNLTKTDLRDNPKYKVQLKCYKCNKLYDDLVSKTKLLQLIHKPAECICLECQEKIKLEEEKQRQNRDLEYNKTIENNTEYYINNFLNPNNSFKKGTPIQTKINEIMNNYPLNNDKIAEYINSMSYYDFLDTPYWDGVSTYMRKKANYKCSLCNSNGILNTHHKTYEEHGYEHLKSVANSTLIVLCQECHSKFHDIEED